MPFRTAHRMRLSDTLIDWMDMKIPNEDVRRMHATVYADIVQHYQNYSPGFKYSRDEASNFPSYWETKEKWNFGPNFVYDTDDDMFNVEPLNPAFRNLGIVHKGQVIPKNYQVILEIPGKGNQVLCRTAWTASPSKRT
jgi:hypothetical protein